ncbi:disulfide bond formation protein DsbA [Malaciobacter canalis]|uniref:Disulfide bond formation protein DsbA n=1 Tax=Malaciobacter canalis TaxID=1912871 RepID=A0ABX4LR73_9BACT|nr:thioredoxin domain-containing protein [Malaciobacter canalis]PHO10105.1 disulfide bond formation protein DsbA [Malaciobacter canalis]QEE32593.1 protein disulfide oxidoreductase, DsbA/G family [Malaciobacter canalis]
MKNKKLVFFTLVIVVAAFVAAITVYKIITKNSLAAYKDTNNAPFVRENSYSFGENKANVVIVEYMDPQCPPCKIFNSVVNDILKQYYKDVKFVVRYLANHDNSAYVIKILEASRAQNKYKQTLDIVFKYQEEWADPLNPRPELIWQYLPKAGLDMEKLKKDFLSIDISQMLEQDYEDATTLGVQGTPTFFVNGKELETLSYQAFFDLVEKEIFE